MCELEENFRQNLIHLRRKSGLTQRELAEKIKANRGSISAWENGICSPNTTTLTTVSRFFKLKVDDLLLYRLSRRKEAQS